MFKKYCVFLLCFLSNTYAMELAIVQEQKIPQKISYEKRLNILCAQQFSHLNEFSKSIERTIKKQKNKKIEHRECIESVLRIGNNLPIELQKNIFSYVFGTEMPEDFFKNQNITSILHIYADDKDFFRLYKEKWSVIHSANCLKDGIVHECIMFDYDQFLALPIDAKLLLEKIIKNNTIVINDITQLSEKQIYNIPSPYKITLAELPIAQKILEKQIACVMYTLYTGSVPEIKNKNDLAEQLKIDIEYDGSTVKDKILVIVPLLLNSALPNLILYGIDHGINMLVPGNGWLNWGMTVTGRFLGFVSSIMSAGYIGVYLFPALDKYNSGVAQLKKFFGKKVRMNIKREDLYITGGIYFICAIIENSAITYGFLPMQIVGYVIRGLRLCFFNHALYKTILFENPIKRGAPVAHRSWSVSYNLRHMQKEK